MCLQSALQSVSSATGPQHCRKTEAGGMCKQEGAVMYSLSVAQSLHAVRSKASVHSKPCHALHFFLSAHLPEPQDSALCVSAHVLGSQLDVGKFRPTPN